MNLKVFGMELIKNEHYKLKRYRVKSKKAIINYKNSLIVVSMDNMHFHNEYSFNQIISWADEKSAKYDFIVGDYLHRLNIRMFTGISIEKATAKALKEGDERIEFLKTNFDFTTRDSKIIRCQEVYGYSNFTDYLLKIYDVYIHNEIFRSSIDKIIGQFIERKKDSIKIPFEEAIQLSKQYLFEELAIFQTLNVQLNKSVNIYPGKWSLFYSFINGDIPDIPKELKNYTLVELKFIKEK